MDVSVSPISRDEERVRLASYETGDVAALVPVLDAAMAALDASGRCPPRTWW